MTVFYNDNGPVPDEKMMCSARQTSRFPLRSDSVYNIKMVYFVCVEHALHPVRYTFVHGWFSVKTSHALPGLWWQASSIQTAPKKDEVLSMSRIFSRKLQPEIYCEASVMRQRRL